jgi:hypothetical protein
MLFFNVIKFALNYIGVFGLYGGEDGGGHTTSTQTTTNIPEYARPYFERLMDRTEAVSNDSYVPYNGQRLQGFTPAQNEAFARVGSMRQPGQIRDATNLTGVAAQGALQNAGYRSGRIGSTYRPQATRMFQGPGRVQSMYRPGQFGAATAAQYMSPHQQAVTDIALREASRQHQQANTGRDAQAAQRGSFGGSRAALVKQEAERAHQQNLSDIQYRGSNDAFNQAQQQFERDRQAQYLASQQGLGAQQFNVQQRMAYGQQGMQNQQFNEQQRREAALMAMQGQQMNEQARAQAAGIRSGAYGMAGQMGSQYANLGRTQQELDLARANALLNAGNQQQKQGQQALDTAYQDFVNQRDYDKQQLAFYSGVMRGVPVGANTDVVSTQPGASSASQLAGLGIAGLGAYGAYQNAQR